MSGQPRRQGVVIAEHQISIDDAPSDDAVFALATVVNRDGRIADYEVLLSHYHSPSDDGTEMRGADASLSKAEVSYVREAVRQTRFSPAQSSYGPVAVNMVWLLTHTTVKASPLPFDLDDFRDGHAKARVHLRELAAGRSAAEDQQAPWQLPGERGLLIGPDIDRLDARDADRPRHRADGDDDVLRGQLVAGPVMGDADAALADDARVAAVEDGTRLLERAHMARVVRLGGVRRAVDHEVAVLRRPRPVVAGRVRVVLRRRMEQRLRWQAADMRATAAEPLPVDHGDRRAERARLVGRRLAARSGPDHDDVEGRRVHGVSLPSLSECRAVVALHTGRSPPRPTR